MTQKNLIIILIAALVLVLGYFSYTRFFVRRPTESQVISALFSNWKETQSRFSVKAGESGTYNTPTEIQFIARDIFFVHYDDGLADSVSLLKCENGTFSEILHVGSLDALRDSWGALVAHYGDANYSISNYANSITRDGTFIDFKSLTKVPENVFVHSN